ncbi:MAG: SusD/RagB family nutrient-binding outer membrane lipoprotein [Cyclobacteriaceae bacterium]|jgi:hypothetical protein|nr:SusD/RagB family nutrient-binding outer membrane lipoprotein [Cyclobacteriaceae bacterium]
MKLTKFFILTVFVWLGSSCTLDLREDPNAVQPNQALPSLILNSMQRNLAGLFNTASSNGMIATRLMNSGGNNYANIWNPQSFDGTWSTAYANILLDGKQLIELADANGLARHAGMARVISAYTLLLLVDSFGDVPYSQALQGSDEFNPGVDNMADVYNEAIALLDKAKTDLTTPTVALGGYLNATAPAISDLYYANNYGNWVRLANSLKLKVYLNLRLTDPTAATAGINAVIADAGGLISTTAQNFTFRYGISQSDPDSRHPRFNANYLAGGGNYMSNYLIWQMFHGYDATQNGQPGDPRIRFYFYRQVSTNNSDPNNIRCVTALSAPPHYPFSTGTAIIYNSKAGVPPGISTNPAHPAYFSSSGLPRTFCYPTDRGYWGRDHVDNQGIPPDNFLRSAWGAYPSGGRFDANVNTSVNANVGMRGAGMQPIMMRSFVQFMLAEAALYLGTTGTARTYYQNGIQASFDDVRAFVAGGAEATTVNTFYPAATYTTDVTNYITAALAAYDAQVGNDNIMNYIAREYWIALYCNGVEAFNLYRRTGLPTGMQPALNDDPGAFPRSFYYPANFATRNSSVTQKSDLTGRIFWDTNTSNLDF